MLSKFQKKLMGDIDTIVEIIRLFHPNIPKKIKRSKHSDQEMTLKELIERQHNNKSQLYCGISVKYDWVIIAANITDYGKIDICVENRHDESMNLCGPHITGEDYEEVLSNGNIIMKAWNTVLDCKYKRVDIDDNFGHIDVTDLLISRGYGFKSTSEFLEYYYFD